MAYVTKHTIMLNHVKTTSVDKLFNLIFWRNPLLADDAKKIWYAIKNAGKEGFQGKNWKVFMAETELNLNNIQMLYLTLRTLRSLGLIYRKGQTYHVSHAFLAKLESIIEVYEEMGDFRSSLRMA